MTSKLTFDIYKISRYTHNFYARELKKLHLTMGQFPFLMEISENDGISQEKLSDLIMISKSTTAVIVQQLMSAGLITRETDEHDRRNFRLHITKEAMVLIPKIREVIHCCHEKITEDLTEIESQILISLLQKVRNRTDLALRAKPRKRKMKS